MALGLSRRVCPPSLQLPFLLLPSSFQVTWGTPGARRTHLCVEWTLQALLLSKSSLRTFAAFYVRNKPGLLLAVHWVVYNALCHTATSLLSWLLVYWLIAGWHALNRLVMGLWPDPSLVSAHTAVSVSLLFSTTPPLFSPPEKWPFTHQRWLCSFCLLIIYHYVLSWNWVFILNSDNV